MTIGLTPHQAKYLAHLLTRRHPADSADRLTGAVAGAQVDLNPHQVDAALFAFQSPLAKGALLADEVGLGKTIEAGLVISQRWAERRRRILVITPANLRKQWVQELEEKFFLPCRILESRSYNQAIKQGDPRPFESPGIVVCSYQFARSKEDDVQLVPWDLVVIDEAHRLRNVYKPSNVIAKTLKTALEGRHKLLLTATPLQNSLMELYGLVSFIDEHVFGDAKSFRDQFTYLDQAGVFEHLKARLRPVCHRTLRRQVTAYIPYTKRLPLVEEFTPAEAEDRLYELVSEYLQRPNLQALPDSQRSLITLVLRKLLASSTFAIAGALATMRDRLQVRLDQSTPAEDLVETLDEDYEILDETAEEWEEDQEEEELLTPENRAAIEREVADLGSFIALASSVDHNAKGQALLKALDVGFRKARELGAAEKAIIFTESRRTQDYLLRLLADSPFSEGIVLFNGTNADERSRAIYADWLARHQGTDRVSGSRTADMRAALVDYFREQGRIMIATEAGAEGINLQFCSLVVNYDLPWNPQRIEQRIGRCHRYGQKHDVVVVNFVNRKNAADRRVYELLAQKFHLFEGVFGASDEVLGALESGVDFEKRIARIYQDCRRPEEIKQAFDALQLELSLEISESLSRTRQQLLEHFDDEVREKLKMRDAGSRAALSRHEELLLRLTQHELASEASFGDDGSFALHARPPGAPDAVPLGRYELPRRSGEAHLYRLSHPLAELVVERAKARVVEPAVLEFQYSDHEGRVSTLEPLVGRSGWLAIRQLSIESLSQGEDHLLIAAVTDDGSVLDRETATRLLGLPARVVGPAPEEAVPQALEGALVAQEEEVQREHSERNARFYEAEAAKLDGWADDLKVGLERVIKELDRKIAEARTAARMMRTLEDKLAGQRRIAELDAERSQRRRSLFEAQDQVDQRRDALIAEIEAKLVQEATTVQVCQMFWRLR